MNIKEETILTLNQYSITGKKINIDLNIIKEYKNLKEIILKNFEVDEELIIILNNMTNLIKVYLINCKINVISALKNIVTLQLENCIVSEKIFSNNIQNLYVQECSDIDIESFINLRLKTLLIEKTKVKNMNRIGEFIDLENLYLNELEIDENIQYEKLSNLKMLNLDGSHVSDKEKFLEQFDNRNINISFTKENKRIG